MNINRGQILISFLDIITGLSDKKYQERVWVQGKGPEFDSYDETVCNFFQDGDGIIQRYEDFGLTETQYNLLVKFRGEFNKFKDKHSWNEWPPDWFDSDEWDKITKKAKDMLEAFNYSFKLPLKIPSDFKIEFSTKQLSKKYVHPEHIHTSLRVMPGKPHSPLPHQRKPYVIQMKDGKTLDKFGNIVDRNLPEAHIPIEEFISYLGD